MLLMDFHVTWMMIIIMAIIQTESAEKSHTPRWPLWDDICLSVCGYRPVTPSPSSIRQKEML